MHSLSGCSCTACAGQRFNKSARDALASPGSISVGCQNPKGSGRAHFEQCLLRVASFPVGGLTFDHLFSGQRFDQFLWWSGLPIVCLTMAVWMDYFGGLHYLSQNQILGQLLQSFCFT